MEQDGIGLNKIEYDRIERNMMEYKIEQNGIRCNRMEEQDRI